MSIATGTKVVLQNGRVAEVSPRTYNTCTGYVVWLLPSEVKALRIAGYSTKRYSYSVDMAGNVERWINGYGSMICNIKAPTIICE